MATPLEARGLRRALTILAPMIASLMALGAGVRTMNAGLACPDWPLCFGKVIPDFHVGVYFEFIHRAYAGLIAIGFFVCLVWALRSSAVPRVVRALGWAGLTVLTAQIVMGGLTVLKLLKTVVVTSHLMLATLFLSCVLWMRFWLERRASVPRSAPVGFLAGAAALPVLVLGQMTLGGLVAASYAGSVCVDFPLCNGQWVPTWSGAIGLQVMHRFGAYFVVVFAMGLAMSTWPLRGRPWMNAEIARWSQIVGLVAFAQTGVGIANLIWYIPPGLTVLHQAMAVALLACAYRLAFVAFNPAEASSVHVSSQVSPQSLVVPPALGSAP